MTTRIARAFRGGFAIIVTLGMALCVAGVARADERASQNFDGMTSSSTAALPSGWKLSGASAPTYSDAANTSAVTASFGTSVTTAPSTGGTYLWVNGVLASGTDKAVGFLTSSSYLGPRSILYQYTNNTGSTLTGLIASWDYEKYRSGTRAFDWTFFYSTDGTNWTAVSAGNQSYSADANITTVLNPPTSTSKIGVPLVASLANGSSLYLRWTYTGNGGSTSAQGLGIDNFRLNDSISVATVTASGGASAATDGWTVSTSGTAGSFQGNSADNGGGSAAGAGNPAWGLYANSGGSVSATRLLGGSVATGQTVSLNFDNGWVESGGSVAIEYLLTNSVSGNETALRFQFANGASSYELVDSSGTRSLSVPFTADGGTASFRITGSGTYSFSWRGSTLTGTLQSSRATVNAIRVINSNAGSDTPRNVYFNTLATSCVDVDQDGVCVATDCNDRNASVGAASVTYYLDGDNDGYGVSSTSQVACSQPSGYTTQAGDCDDTKNSVYTGAPELCDGLDNDCDTTVDEDITFVNYYPDVDGDGFGAAGSSPTSAC